MFSYTIPYWKRVVQIAIIRRKFSNSKLKSTSRLSTKYINTTFWSLEAGTRVADVQRSFGCNEQTTYRLRTRFLQHGSKNDKIPLGRQLILTSLEVRIIVTSSWRNRFIAAWKLLKHLRHATGTRFFVCTARNRLRGSWLIFEFWNLNFWYWPLCVILMKKGVYFQIVLLKMFTFVRN